MRLQIETENEDIKVIEDIGEIKAIYNRLCQTKIVAESFIAGIGIKDGDKKYTLID